MAGTNILVRQKDLIAGSGISITPDTTSGNVTIAATNTAIDESRLIPTGGKDGDILGYQEGADRGNNVNTKLLLQPATSDGLIVDQAAGNAAPVGITNSGNVAIAANALVFSGENALIIEPDTLGMTLGGNNEYSIEVDFQLDQVKSDWATLFGGDGSMTRSAFYINSSGATAVQGGIAPDTTGWTTGTRHRLTIERFQDGDSWKTVIYRNGAVLATSVTTPNTLSGDRFPIGSNLEGTGRNFVGKIWAFRISNKAEHRGVSFTPRELPFLPPAGQPVWTEGIDRSRLLPENPANGDIPCFDATATVGGGNDSDTVLLIQPVTSNNQIVNQAVGGGDRVVLQNTNVMVFNTGEMTFAGNAYLSFNPNSVTSLFLKDGMPWTLDLVYNVSSKSMQCLFGRSTSPRMDFLLQSNGNLEIGGGPSLGSGWPFDTDVRLTFEVYMEGGNQKYTAFRDGTPVASGTWSVPNLHDSTLWIGWDGNTDSRKITGWIKALRMTDTATHNGAAFTPDELPWTEPQVVGEWSTINKSVLVRSVNSRTPDSSGAVTIPAATASAAGLRAAADKEKLNKFNGYGVPAKRIITAADLNTLKTSGTYALYDTAVYSNIPAGETAGWLIVKATEAGAEQIRQEFVPMTANLERRYVRRYNINTDIWTDWVHNYFAMWALDPIDFNQLTDVGVYFVNGSHEHINYPSSNASIGGILTVQGIGFYRTQSFAAMSSPNQSVTWTRWGTLNGSSWTFQEWRKLLIDLDITESKTRSGYFKLPGGTIVQWGVVFNITADGTTSVVFPIAFPNTGFANFVTAVSGTASASGVVMSTTGASVTGFTVITKNHPGGDKDINAHWLAIGY